MSVNSTKLNIQDYNQSQLIIDFLIDKGSIPLILQFLTSIPEPHNYWSQQAQMADRFLSHCKVANVNMPITRAIISHAHPGNFDHIALYTKNPEFLRLYLEYGLNLVTAIRSVLEGPELDSMFPEILNKASYLFPGVHLIDLNNQPLISKVELKRLMKGKWPCYSV